MIIESDYALLEILPEYGGKITRLFDKVHSHEWLWRNPHLDLRQPLYGESYIEALDFGGWDEIFPSVAPCQLELGGNLIELPDHGDLVQLPWSAQLDSQSLEMAVRGRCFDFQFTRRIELKGPVVSLSYGVKNLGEFAFPWLWCAHPLVPMSDELSVETDACFSVLYAGGGAQGLVGARVHWSDLPSGETHWAAKLFSDKGAVSDLRLRHRSGASLTFSWDPNEIPYLGLWANRGSWSGCGSLPYYNLGIEPAMLPVDNLSLAENALMLDTNESQQWSLSLTF